MVNEAATAFTSEAEAYKDIGAQKIILLMVDRVRNEKLVEDQPENLSNHRLLETPVIDDEPLT